MDEQRLQDALADRAIVHKGSTYRATLVRLQRDPISKAVDLAFTAKPVVGEGERIRLELHLSEQSFNDEAYTLQAIDDTVIAILDGQIPPGATQLL